MKDEVSPVVAAWGWSDTFRAKLARYEEDLERSLALDTIDVEIAVERNYSTTMRITEGSTLAFDISLR